MRYVITNAEQTAAIRDRRPFGTRRLGRGDYVYMGVPNLDGTYTLWHWNTRIARLDATTEGGGRFTWLDDEHRSTTTSAYRRRIWAALTDDERQSAAYGIVQAMRRDAIAYPRLHADAGWRNRLARWEGYAYAE